jgi:hypothetical protein
MPSYKHEPCKNCGELFYFPGRRYCSDTCRAEGRARHRYGAWAPEEIEILTTMVGVEPFPLVLQAVQDFNRAKGMQVRTAIAIRSKAKKYTGSSLCPGGDYRNKDQIRRQLGICAERITGWFEGSDPLQLAAKTSKRWEISLKDFEAWARRNRHRLAGIPLEKIAPLVQDVEFFRESSAWPTARRTVRPVRNIDTGEVYPSVYVASKAQFVSAPAIYKSIRLSRSAAGARWQYITGEEYAAAAMLGETAA